MPEKVGALYAAETISRCFLVAVVMWAVHVVRTPDPSQLLTCGAALHLLSLVALVLAPGRAGLPPASFEAMVLLAAGLALRLSSTTWFQGYLPVDSSGDGPYQVLEGTTFLLALKVMAYFEARAKEPLPWRPALSAATVCAVWAAACYGGLNHNPTFDGVFAMSIYVEMCSVIFQSVHLYRMEPATVPYAFLLPQALGFACRLHFWLCAGEEVSPVNPVRLQELFPMCLAGCTLVGLLSYGALALRGALEQPKVGTVTVGELPKNIPGLRDCRKLVPLSAVYTEEGLLRVTYRPVSD